MDVRLQLAAAGLFLLFGQPAPPTSEPGSGWLRLRTPGINVHVTVYSATGERIEMGQTGLIVDPLLLPAGSARICLHEETLKTLCRDIEITPGLEATWTAWPNQFPGWRAVVTLPGKVTTVDILTEGHPGVRIENPAEQLHVAPRADHWLVMHDADGQQCLCHTPPLAPAEVYECWWPCSP